jgi:hypothetical protein
MNIAFLIIDAAAAVTVALFATIKIDSHEYFIVFIVINNNSSSRWVKLNVSYSCC